MNGIHHAIQASIAVKSQICQDKVLLGLVSEATQCMVEAFRKGGRVLFCGNGGSAADAQHLAAEFSGRFYFDRPPLDSEALHTNTSFLTAVANDYSYEEVYARLVQAKGRPGDVVVGLSTSGNSANILLALQKAKSLGIKTVALTGATGGKMADVADIVLRVPSTDTPRIQEAHILLGHVICEQVEKELFT